MSSHESNKKFAQLRNDILSQNGKEYWRSVEEFAGSKEFEDHIAGEFPVDVENWDKSLSRRNFMKVMGASLAFAGLTGCVIQPPEKIVPYVRPVEDMLPGKALFYATSMTIGGVATGMLVKAFEGRPVKIEGNPEHPGSMGTSSVFAQASILDLYDPDRSQQILDHGNPSSWQNFSTALRASIDANRGNGGAGIRFLTGSISSPSMRDQFRRLQQELPAAKWVQYEPLNADNAHEGAKLAFGEPVNTVYRFDRAERILSIDSDIFSGPNTRYVADFGKARNYTQGEKTEINRVYAIETTTTLFGVKADHRLAVKPSQVGEIVKAIAKAVGVAGAESTYTENAEWLTALANDLNANRGKTLVIAGDHQPPEIHALVHAMNSALGSVGETLYYTEPLMEGAEKSQAEQLRELVADIDAGNVKMLVILGANPLYNSPADLKFTEDRFKKVDLRVHVGQYVNETAELCHWHVSEKHYLESWADSRTFDGTVALTQPLIDPLYGSRSPQEVLQLFFKDEFDKKDLEIVRSYWENQSVPTASAPVAAIPASTPSPENGTVNENGAEEQPTPAVAAPAATPSAASNSFEDRWRKWVHDGFIANTALPARSVTAGTSFLAEMKAPTGSGELEIAILPDPSVLDGQFSNNGWMQELPNPLTKITWDNVALVSPETAKRLELNRGNDPREISGGERGIAFINTHGSNMTSDLVRLTYQGGEIQGDVPIWISPGQPDDVITIYMGYGRRRAGKVGTDIGYNAFDVRRSDAPTFGFGSIAKTGTKTTIATTQIHFNLENVDGRSRDILRVWDIHHIDEHLIEGKQPDFKGLSMYPTEFYDKQYAENYKWGMSIDLNACTGCNACIIACQSENNIPVVGKEQVQKSREMHWLRVDTYYTGDDVNNPGSAHFQPIVCMQCEQAPCEVVCPVTATVHSPEGLNDMVYNRCVGTRYCSNNCPYKVRRFNFFLYQDWDTPQYKLMRNPEVSVRSRGVMEKCTFCTQRISLARIEAEKAGRRIQDGEVMTACQSICPTGAIVFGDMNDPLSKVAKIKQDERNYILLNDLNTLPRTTYMAELKNKNTEMPGYTAPTFKAKSTDKKKEEGAH